MEKMLQAIVKHFGVCEIEEKGIWVTLNTDYVNNKWDIKLQGKSKWFHDLSDGKVGEKWTDRLLDDNTIEVKREMYDPDGFEPWKKWYRTGNVAIEVQRKEGLDIVPTGLSITEATTWVHLLSFKDEIRTGFIFEVSELKRLVKRLLNEHPRNHDTKSCSKCESGCKGVWISWGGDRGVTKNIIVPIHLLYMY